MVTGERLWLEWPSAVGRSPLTVGSQMARRCSGFQTDLVWLVPFSDRPNVRHPPRQYVARPQALQAISLSTNTVALGQQVSISPMLLPPFDAVLELRQSAEAEPSISSILRHAGGAALQQLTISSNLIASSLFRVLKSVGGQVQVVGGRRGLIDFQGRWMWRCLLSPKSPRLSQKPSA